MDKVVYLNTKAWYRKTTFGAYKSKCFNLFPICVIATQEYVLLDNFRKILQSKKCFLGKHSPPPDIKIIDNYFQYCNSYDFHKETAYNTAPFNVTGP